MFPGGAQGSMRRLSGDDSEAVRCSFSAFLGKQVEGIGGRKCCDFFSTWEGIEALRLTRVFHYGASGFGLPGAFFAFKRRERRGGLDDCICMGSPGEREEAVFPASGKRGIKRQRRRAEEGCFFPTGRGRRYARRAT